MDERIQEIIDVGCLYRRNPSFRFSEKELAELCERALEQFRTMNGDTGPVTLTVRQLAILVCSALTGEPWQEELADGR